MLGLCSFSLIAYFLFYVCPVLKHFAYGLGYLVGKLHAKINPNIKTGNFSKTATDVKNHAEQEDIFKWISFKSAVADIDSLLANAQYPYKHAHGHKPQGNPHIHNT